MCIIVEEKKNKIKKLYVDNNVIVKLCKYLKDM